MTIGTFNAPLGVVWLSHETNEFGVHQSISAANSPPANDVGPPYVYDGVDVLRCGQAIISVVMDGASSVTVRVWGLPNGAVGTNSPGKGDWQLLADVERTITESTQFKIDCAEQDRLYVEATAVAGGDVFLRIGASVPR